MTAVWKTVVIVFDTRVEEGKKRSDEVGEKPLLDGANVEEGVGEVDREVDGGVESDVEGGEEGA